MGLLKNWQNEPVPLKTEELKSRNKVFFSLFLNWKERFFFRLENVR